MWQIGREAADFLGYILYFVFFVLKKKHEIYKLKKTRSWKREIRALLKKYKEFWENNIQEIRISKNVLMYLLIWDFNLPYHERFQFTVYRDFNLPSEYEISVYRPSWEISIYRPSMGPSWENSIYRPSMGFQFTARVWDSNLREISIYRPSWEISIEYMISIYHSSWGISIYHPSMRLKSWNAW